MSVPMQIIHSAPPHVGRFRVFNDALVDRLAKVNAAARALRRMGYRIVREDLCGTSAQRPIIEISRNRIDSLIPLLDYAALAGSRPHWLTLTSCPRFAIDVLGVTVMCAWDEA
jgi:hypothetical protein